MKRWLVVAVTILLGLSAACQSKSQLSPIQTNLLLFDQTVERTLDSPGTHDWLFVGQARQQIAIILQTLDAPLNAILYAPSGAEVPILLSDDPENTSIRTGTVELPQNGTYRLSIAATTAGIPTYRLTVANVSSPPPTVSPAPAPTVFFPSPTAFPLPDVPPITPTGAPLRVGSGARLQPYRPIRGQIMDIGGSEHYTIFAPAGAMITIGARRVPGSSVHPALTLYAPSGDILAESMTSGSEETVIAGVQLPVTGAYVLYVRADNNRASGPYDLSFGYGLTFQEHLQPEPPPDAVVSGLLTAPFTRDIWPITLNLGDIISAAVVVDGNRFRPALTLLAPDGQSLYTGETENNGYSTALRQVIAPQTGQFHLAVASAESGKTGSYTLLWQYNARAPTPPPGR